MRNLMWWGVSFALVLEGCSKKDTKPSRAEPAQLVTSLPGAVPPSVTSPDVKVSGGIYLSRDQVNALLNKEFLYTSNLQYTETKDESLGFETMQVLALGNLKVGSFKLDSTSLQFMVEESTGVESDFSVKKVYLDMEIQDQDSSGFTFKIANVAGGASQSWKMSGISERWLRSVEFFEKDQTLVWETSLVTQAIKDGALTTNHFAESIMPRSRFGLRSNALVLRDEPKAKPDFHYLDLLGRVGTFQVESFIKPELETEWNQKVVKVKTITANRYDISENKTIDWYVTENLPDDLLTDIQAGVEGWNRYFNSFRSDKVMRFLGKLPKGVKLGDPRYNVVRFDAVSEAGAAYESQNADPETGIQTQSMIYMPFAWYNIANRSFVDTLRSAEAGSGTENGVVAKFRNLKCKRELNFGAEAMQMMLEKSLTTEEAGRALMRSTLLHEVGHALGMEHNFRGSNSGQLATRLGKDWRYSDSVMDYNVPMIEDVELYSDLGERGEAKDPTKGQKLAYDAQFIDIVYNKGLLTTDEPVGYCNDEGADDVVNGVSPTCIRYDIFAGPEESLRFITSRLDKTKDVTSSKDGGYLTLTGATKAIAKETVSKIAVIKSTDKGASESKAAVLEVLNQSIQKLANAEKLYFTSGHGSMASVMREVVQLLGEWKAVPVDTTKDSRDARLEGWNLLPIFDANGNFDQARYVAYQNEVKTTLSDILATSLSVDGNERSRGGREILISAFKDILKQSQLDREFALETQSLEATLTDQIIANEEAILDRTLTLIDSVPKKVAKEKGFYESRPNVSGAILRKIVDKYEGLVASDEVSTDTKLSVVTSFVSLVAERAESWDGIEDQIRFRELRATMAYEIGEGLTKLDQKYKTSGYLNEQERMDQENLSEALKLLKI
ncbi:MAG: zinc-dependent metalloprotease [Pseudomonadota bacterium]